jgi:hypothetical protein
LIVKLPSSNQFDKYFEGGVYQINQDDEISVFDRKPKVLGAHSTYIHKLGNESLY